MHIMNRQPSFVKEIASSLRHRCDVNAGDRLLMGVSGGADSVALLRAMAYLAGRRNRETTLIVGHVNHHLRTDADDEAQFVANLAKELGLAFLEVDLTPPAKTAASSVVPTAVSPQENIEQWARQSRYAALKTMAAQCDAAAVVTAHHADDQLETMLMRLMRGSSAKALAGMRWRRKLAADTPIKLLRPMLGVTHQQALDYLQSLGQSWREDHTNADTTRLRAALRAKVLPQLKVLSPQLTQRVSQTSDHLHGVARVLKTAIEKENASQVVKAADDVRYARAAARLADAAVVQGLLHQLFIEMGVPADSLRRSVVVKIASAMRDTQGGCRAFTFANHVTAELDKTHLTIGRTSH